jgi:16S rRNA (cytidine1402-2'-O)-methyltransferase
MRKTGTLYLIPTVLAADTAQAVIPEQVKEAVRLCSHFLVEEIRTARRYISSLRLGLVIEDLHFEQLSKKTDERELERLMKPLLEGKSMGVISESGCPGVADPGALAVARAHRLGISVVPLTGPSSLLLGLMASGFNGQRFAFQGYLPIDKKERQEAIRRFEKESAKLNQTQLFIETPFRNDSLLQGFVEACHPDTRLCVAKDLTGADQWIRTATLREWKTIKVTLHKIPTVFILYAGV